MEGWPPVDKGPAGNELNDEEILKAWDYLNRTSLVQYVVDVSGAGTHKTIAKAMEDAATKPKSPTMIRIKPHITIDNFTQESEGAE